MRRLVPLFLFVFALALCSSKTAFADNLLVNGGFERGNFSGWTLLNSNHTYVETAGFDNLAPSSGDYFAALGSVDTRGLLSQSFLDVFGRSYTLSFDLAGDGARPSDLSVFLDGFPIFNLVNVLAGGYQTYTFQFTGHGLDNVSFLSRDNPGYLALDDVRVSRTAVTPEPASLTLLATGLTGLGAMLRRRKNVA